MNCILKPFACCFHCGACCCCSCKDIFSACCCRCFFPPKRPTWNKRFEITVNVVRHLTFNINYDIHFMRHIADQDIPTWLPQMPKGISMSRGKSLVENTSLPPYEWIYPTEDGCPTFDDSTSNCINRKVILYFHGGAFCFGSRGSHRMLLFYIAKATGATVISIDYRRAPEFPHPTPGKDCLEAYKWLASKINPANIIVAGDSAGGALVMDTLVAARDSHLPLPAGGILISPWVDIFDTETPSFAENVCFDFLPPPAISYCNKLYLDPPRDNISALYQDLSGLPPLLIEIGASEVLRDQIRLFAEKAREAQVQVTVNEYPDMVHVFQMLAFTKMQTCQDSFSNMAIFVSSLSGDSDSRLLAQAQSCDIDTSAASHHITSLRIATPSGKTGPHGQEEPDCGSPTADADHIHIVIDDSLAH